MLRQWKSLVVMLLDGMTACVDDSLIEECVIGKSAGKTGSKEALRLASTKLPVPTEFVTTASAPRLGNKVLQPAAAASATDGPNSTPAPTSS